MTICRACKQPVRRVTHKAGWEPKPKQEYYFDYWFKCTNRRCRKLWMEEEGKRFTGYVRENLDRDLADRIARER